MQELFPGTASLPNQSNKIEQFTRSVTTCRLTNINVIPQLWVAFRGCAAWVNAPSKAGADFVATTWPWPLTFSFGIVKARPFVIDNQVVVKETIPLVLVFDRRIMGGGPASRLFAEFQKLLIQCEELYSSEFEMDRGEKVAGLLNPSTGK